MDQPWRIELLGWLRATHAERVVASFRTQKAGALLAYLAFYRHRSHPRETLIELLWPECDPKTGRHRLRKALSSLRQQLEPPAVSPVTVILTDLTSVQLNPAVCITDVAQFEAACSAGLPGTPIHPLASRVPGRVSGWAGVADREIGAPPAARAGSDAERARRLAEAVELYRGPLLPGYYEDWIVPEKQRLEDLFFQALRQLIAHFEQRGDLEQSLQYAHRAVAADPLREEAHHELIRLYAASGQPRAALRQYAELERILTQELHATPAAATRALVASLHRCTDPASGITQHPIRSGTRGAGDGHQVITRSPLSFRQLEPVGGAVPLDSSFYVLRRTDREFEAAIARQDSIVLVKGTREVGKSSLLARGLHQARQAGATVVLTDFQLFSAAHLASAETLFPALAQSIADQLDLDVAPADVWDARRGANFNFRRYLIREVLGALATPLVWGLDQVDRLFSCDFGHELFGLFRSWHNDRAFDPAGPWSRLTLAMAYATEAHLFITDADQSPFNVGTRLTLDDFTGEQVAELNGRYGGPLRGDTEFERFYRLVGGHPHLVRRGLLEMATHGTDFTTFEARAASGEWIYGDHLRRVRALLARDAELCEVMRGVLAGKPCPTLESFYRLRSGGLVSGRSEASVRPRCQLYATYLQRHLL